LQFGSLRVTEDPSNRRRPVLPAEPAFAVCPVRSVNASHGRGDLLEATAAVTAPWRRTAAGSMRTSRSTRTALARPRLSLGPDPMPSTDYALGNAGLRRGRGPCLSECGEALTGIEKPPMSQPVLARAPGTKRDVLGGGLVDDTVCDRRNHGGRHAGPECPCQSGSGPLGSVPERTLPGWVFGENLTTAGIDVTGGVIGER
jgi:hypothetical protein